MKFKRVRSPCLLWESTDPLTWPQPCFCSFGTALPTSPSSVMMYIVGNNVESGVACSVIQLELQSLILGRTRGRVPVWRQCQGAVGTRSALGACQAVCMTSIIASSSRCSSLSLLLDHNSSRADSLLQGQLQAAVFKVKFKIRAFQSQTLFPANVTQKHKVDSIFCNNKAFILSFRALSHNVTAYDHPNHSYRQLAGRATS